MNCEERARLLAADELHEAPWRRRFAAWFHGWMCPPCRDYERQIQAIGDAVRDYAHRQGSDARTLERLESDILDRLCPESAEGPSGESS